MAKITIAGDAVVVTSAMKLEDLKTIAKYRPDALYLKGGEDNKEKVFVISTNGRGAGEINKYGATFTSETHDDEKLATITMGIGDACSADVKEYVAELIGSAIINLNKLEATLPDVLADIAAEKDAVMSNITVAQ